MITRRFLALAALAVATSTAFAQPASRIIIVAPFPPGGPVDTLSRLLADGLQKKQGRTALVENVPGGAGNIGIDRVKRARPDGDTLLVIPAGNLTINPTLMPNFPFDIQRDFVPVTMLATAPNVLVAGPGAGVKNVQELLAQAKAKPGTLSYASPGVGSGLHLAGELFKQQTGADILHVPYKGTGPALNDVLGGTVPLMFSNLPATLGHIKSGKLVALGVTDKQRTSVAPEIPTLLEQGVKGVEVTSWYGLMAPAGTPAEVAARLAKDAQDILSQPAVREQLKAQGLQPVTMTPAEYAAHIQAETATWAGILKSRNIKAE
ncbi:Bug family tripartite tricarboxylate transporter substrate binding protein [Ramlibacter rhizophilus]|uniref:Tripartite tricarboxylate transporter substrate binding protein n=1 Tax=Ramlibacter rhizophilus TaxID=1781167 RepID=A0A4Z0BEL1_9BURK|nr:tripartite tricarboxylate transporter substrate binding protein [Ramlibacter rhizophilus]TFY97250.1 tripartite tricarboxylate transporter substrate binding protein [Ramlibacter rhizophilus]